jgi:hypothetical protein
MELLDYEFNENKSVKENTSENVERILEKVKNLLYNFKDDLNHQHFRNLRIDYFPDSMFEKPIDEFLANYKKFLTEQTEWQAIEFLSEFKEDESFNAEMKAA